MLHVGELAKILAFLGDQREKLVASDALFAGVLKKDGDANEMSGTGGGGTLYLSHPVYPCTSFDEEKKQLAARRDRERQLKERRAKLEAQGITNRTEDEIEAMEMEGERGASKSSTQILGGGNDSKNPTMKVITFPELKKDAVGGGGQKSSTAAGGAAFIKEKPSAAAGAGKAASGLAGLKSNNVAIKIFSNEGPPLELRVPNTATVGQVVEEYVKVRRNASTTLNTSASSIGLPGREAYSLLIAEDDGSIDSDFEEVLKSTQFIKNFGSCFFIRNEGGGSGGGEGIGKVTRVHLPNHEYQTVKITPGMQAKELLSKVCKRAGAIEMSDHYLHLKSTDSEGPISLHISLDAVIKSDNFEISVRTKREHQSYIHAPKEFWSEAEAMAYKNYTVNKLLRFGMVKERMLGVHHDKLTSSSYHGKSLREHFSWPLRSLESVELISSMKPCQFRATMRTDKSELKVYTFEARTAEEACEIVGKLQYCSKKMKEGKENVK